MKVAQEELRLLAHELAEKKDYEGAVDNLLEIKKQTKLYSWDVAFYLVYYQILDETEVEDAVELLGTMNKATLEALSIIAIHLDGSPRSAAPFEQVHDKLKSLGENLLTRVSEEFYNYVERYKLSSKQQLKLKEDYVKQLEKILSLSETYINCMGSLVEFIPVNVTFMWNFFKLNDEIYCNMIPYENGEQGEKRELKRSENIQIIHLQDPDYKPQEVKESILPEVKKWWNLGLK